MTLLHRVYAQNLRDLRASPESAVRAASETLLARLLVHAGASTAFYANLSDALDAAAGGDAEAWASLPVLSAAELRAVGPGLLAAAIPDREVALDELRSWTSLSTPLEGPLGLLADVADKAQWELLAREAEVDTRGYLAAILPAYAMRPGDMTSPAEPWSLDADRGRALRWPDAIQSEALLEWLTHLRPGALFIGSGALLSLLDVARPDATRFGDILAWGEALPSDAAERCRTAFGARLIEVVASDLAGFVAVRDAGGGCAPAQETIFVEIVDEAGRPCSAEEPGRLVATALYSYRRPVIRHALGARAAWRSEPSGRPRRFELLRADA